MCKPTRRQISASPSCQLKNKLTTLPTDNQDSIARKPLFPTTQQKERLNYKQLVLQPNGNPTQTIYSSSCYVMASALLQPPHNHMPAAAIFSRDGQC
jgi:hypothetical protein